MKDIQTTFKENYDNITDMFREFAIMKLYLQRHTVEHTCDYCGQTLTCYEHALCGGFGTNGQYYLCEEHSKPDYVYGKNAIWEVVDEKVRQRKEVKK